MDLGKVTVRVSRESDISAIVSLIEFTSLVCCFNAEQPCPDWYRASLHALKPPAWLREQATWVALSDQRVVGVLVLLPNSVKYFFVHPDYQRKGIGFALWQAALLGLPTTLRLTVRASLVAVGAYQRLGFVCEGTIQTIRGVSYQEMSALVGDIAAAL